MTNEEAMNEANPVNIFINTKVKKVNKGKENNLIKELGWL
jgi:hypothetical protein